MERYRLDIQRVVGCVSPDVLSIQTRDSSGGRQYDIALKRGNLVVLSDEIAVRLIESITVDTDSRVVAISGYGYTLFQASGHEMISYHWHPAGRSSIIAPHAHIGPAFALLDASIRRGSLHKVHFPTGIVSLAAVIRLVIVELGVEPLRSDWDAILQGQLA